MKIYVNYDENKECSKKSMKILEKTCSKLDITLTEDINKVDIVFSIGGDGTLLETSRISYQHPLIGINCGTLGYLTDVKPEEIEEALKNLKDGNYYIEERMMLEGEIIRENKEKISIPPSLNDIFISKNTFGVIRFDTIIDDKLINSYTADGIIVCTPTGSTAYNLSCGGPIVDPTADIITVTPIAAHTLMNRSIIISNKSVIQIKITQLRGNTKSYVLHDGKEIEISVGDTVKVYKSSKKTKLVKFTKQSFIDTIRKNIK